jgi:hypothetical protein
MLLIGGNTRREQVGSADPLKLGRDLPVIQAGMIAAVAADELERVGVTAFGPAPDDADGPTAQNNCPPNRRLTGLYASPAAGDSIA